MKKAKTLIRIIFVLLSIIFFLTSHLLNIGQNYLLSDIMKELGVVILGIVMLEALWSALGGDPQIEKLESLERLVSAQTGSFENLVSANELLQSATQCGLIKVYEISREAHNKLLEELKSSKRTVDLQGFTASDLTSEDNWLVILRERMAAGVRVSILIQSPENPSLAPSGENAYRQVEVLRKQAEESWKALADFYGKLSPKEKESISIYKLVRGIMSISIRRFDSTMYVIYYLTHHDTRETPLYVVKGEDRPLFQKCIHEFQINIEKNAYQLEA